MHFLDHDLSIYSSSAAINCIAWFPEDDRMNIGETGADVSIATIPMPAKEAAALGICTQIAEDRRIVQFVEKPKDGGAGFPCMLPRKWYPNSTSRHGGMFHGFDGYLRLQPLVVRKLLDNDHTDFGHHPPLHRNTPRLLAYLSGLLGGHQGRSRVLRINLNMAAELPSLTSSTWARRSSSRPRFSPARR